MTHLSSLERYRPLVDDWPAFAAALARPLPTVVWANRLRIEPGELARRLAASGPAPEPLPWLPDAFRLPADAKPGSGLEFAAGLCHVQEEASLIPPFLLAAEPGERVLDLCAAPGGKTVRIALGMGGMGDRGTLVANDRDLGRLGPLRRTAARLGLTSLAITAWDAVNYPLSAGPFDRVLVDAPCSCEGTSRKNPEVLGRESEAERRRLAHVQRLILAKAVRLVRPGGRVVYATCTYAPEENELVVDAVLREAGGSVAVVPARVPALTASPGVTAWQGWRLAPELAGALRIWPHQNDTGGFFVAVLERVAEESEGGGEGAEGEPSARGAGAPFVGEVTPVATLSAPDPAMAERWLAGVTARFGFPSDLFAPYRPVAGGRKRLGLVRRETAPPVHPSPRGVGLPVLRPAAAEPKLTTAGAMAFGAAASRNTVELDRPRAEAYLTGRDLTVSDEELGRATTDGYVLVRHEGIPLGVGFFRRDEVQGADGAGGVGGRLASLYPKGWRLGGVE